MEPPGEHKASWHRPISVFGEYGALAWSVHSAGPLADLPLMAQVSLEMVMVGNLALKSLALRAT